jgi:hypothetical protein
MHIRRSLLLSWREGTRDQGRMSVGSDIILLHVLSTYVVGVFEEFQVPSVEGGYASPCV